MTCKKTSSHYSLNIPLHLIGKRLFSTAKVKCVWEGLGLRTKIRTHRLVSVVAVLVLVEELVFVLLCSGREL